MMNGFTIWVARRLQLRAAGASTSVGVFIAVTGIALALMIMEISMAVCSGFQQDIRSKIIGIRPGIQIMPASTDANGVQQTEMHLNEALTKTVADALPDGILVARLCRQAVLKTDNDFAAIECIGLDNNHDFTYEHNCMVEGVFPTFSNPESQDSIVISETLANSMHINPGDRVFLHFFIDGDVKTRKLTVSGFYSTHFEEYDATAAYVGIKWLRNLGSDKLAASALTVEGIAPEHIAQACETVTQAVNTAFYTQQLEEPYAVTDIYNSAAYIFDWLDLLDTNVLIIFILMGCVAAFTLISSLFIIILDRVSTIGLLRAIGASKAVVSQLFIFMALRIVGIGLAIGNILGIGLLMLQQHTHALPLDPEMYYLTYVPVSINWWTMIALNIATIAVAWAILIIPARLAGRIDPSRTMRYE